MGSRIQRLYTRDTDLDVSIAAADGDLVLVHEGYHTVATAPGTNAYYLNFLAGDTKPVPSSTTRPTPGSPTTGPAGRSRSRSSRPA